MRRTLLLCAIGVSLWSAVAAAGQSPGSGALSVPLRSRVQNGKFDVVTSVRGLPLGVRDKLQTMFGGALDIAEPTAPFAAPGRGATPQVPSRRMVVAGCSTDFYCLIYYERAGGARTWHVALFHWAPAETRFEWGGSAPAGLATLDDVRKAILSGAIKAAQDGPW